jgi:hypothetical protein
MAVIILTIGNLMYLVQVGAAPLHVNRPFPLNWIIFLLILAGGSLLCAFGSIALVGLMQPAAGPYWVLLRETWKIVVVVSTGVGIAGYAVQEVQRKLQERNKLLEQVVERRSVALQQQEQELNRAREIQTDLLPKTLPQLPGVELAGAWQPARAVGGDYFDVILLGDSRLGICIGDVSGKGTRGAADGQSASRVPCLRYSRRETFRSLQQAERICVRKRGARNIHNVLLRHTGRAKPQADLRKRRTLRGLAHEDQWSNRATAGAGRRIRGAAGVDLRR